MSCLPNVTFVHPRMTVKTAAMEAARRGLVLRVSWTKAGGLVVVAVPRETDKPGGKS
jgi:hypothetical protein